MNFQLALIWMYTSSKERSFEYHSNAPLIFVLEQILTILFHFLVPVKVTSANMKLSILYSIVCYCLYR